MRIPFRERVLYNYYKIGSGLGRNGMYILWKKNVKNDSKENVTRQEKEDVVSKRGEMT